MKSELKKRMVRISAGVLIAFAWVPFSGLRMPESDKPAEVSSTFTIWAATPDPAPTPTSVATSEPTRSPAATSEPTPTPVVTPEQTPTAKPDVTVDENDAELLAKLIYGEAGSDWISTEEKAAVAWCVLNRVDTYGGSIKSIVTAPGQFAGYSASNPVKDRFYDLAVDVLTRWQMEKQGDENVGRVLPENYLWFTGDGQNNYFRDAFSGGRTWNWSLPDPYDEVK